MYNDNTTEVKIKLSIQNSFLIQYFHILIYYPSNLLHYPCVREGKQARVYFSIVYDAVYSTDLRNLLFFYGLFLQGEVFSL